MGPGAGSETATLVELEEGVAGERQANREDPWADETDSRKVFGGGRKTWRGVGAKSGQGFDDS